MRSTAIRGARRPSQRVSVLAHQQQQSPRTSRLFLFQNHKLATILFFVVLLSYVICVLGILVVLEEKTTNCKTNSSLRGRGLFDSLFQSTTLISLHENNDNSTTEIDTTIQSSFFKAAVWPVTIHNETFERIRHPANPNVSWTVPKFWSPPMIRTTINSSSRFLSRDTYMQIGSCRVPDARGKYARGADCPTHQRTMFVMIASYRDFQCRETVESLFARASYPDRLRVGIVDQLLRGDPHCNAPVESCEANPNQVPCARANQIHVVTMDAADAVGPVPARHVGHRMYRGEYYAVQSDAHVAFVKGWDMSLILELESTGNEMAVLSTYLSDVVGAMDEDGYSTKVARPIMCNSYWQEALGSQHVHHSTQPECVPAVTGTPQLHPWWSAGFSFSRGHFIVNVPYDLYQPMVFSGEEMSIAIRGWTMGYDYYTPEKSVAFHYYQDSAEVKAKRGKVPTFWENAERYRGAGVKGMRRLLGIVHMLPADTDSTYDRTDESIYGLGNVRTPEKLMRILGINVKQHTMQGHLCQFVRLGSMHNLFTKHLRDDGMGIDYDAIDYKWVDEENENADDGVDYTSGDNGGDDNTTSIDDTTSIDEADAQIAAI
jgi:[Skp1-protein]-hydroxyproline N-acetylglucosaminyltransferase